MRHGLPASGAQARKGDARMAETDAASDNAIDLSAISTLIIDHDRFTRSLVVQMLRSFAMPEPALAGDGEAAQAYLKDHAVDLCICEAALPDMSSGALIHWIRRHAPGAMPRPCP